MLEYQRVYAFQRWESARYNSSQLEYLPLSSPKTLPTETHQSQKQLLEPENNGTITREEERMKGLKGT